MEHFKKMNSSQGTIELFNKEAQTNQSNQIANVAPDPIAQNYWNKCAKIIEDVINSPRTFATWFNPAIPVKFEANVLTLQFPSQFFIEWLDEHYAELIQRTLVEVVGHDAKLKYEVVVKKNNEDSLENRTIRIPAFRNTPTSNLEKSKTDTNFNSGLNSRYTFANFIVGDSNQLASSAAKAVAKNPGGTKYNPLFIYGDTGLGKTHLVQAIGNEILAKNPRAKVLYTNSENYTVDFISAIMNNKQSEFTKYYRDIDVLIIDDIQFLVGKDKTQDHFFHTFNHLHQSAKQLILTSDKAPKDLQGLDDRLISRFQWGLTVDLQRPDLETRMAILSKKSQDEGIELPMDVLEFLATNASSSIRELEGALISLLAKYTFDRKELNVNLAKEVIGNLASVQEPKQITINVIKELVSEFYKVPIDKMESASRKHEIALSRQMSMYLAKRFTELSLKAIGANFGGRDHSTVLHSCTTIDNYLDTDRKVKADYEYLFNTLLKMSR